jgi:chromosomal replication initiation ATPase DnaA
MNRQTQKLESEITRLKEYLREQRYINTCLRKQLNALKQGEPIPPLPNYQETLVGKLRKIIETMYGVDISQRTRLNSVVMARHLFHHYLCYNTSYSLVEIGGLLGLHLHHSTPIHSRKLIEDLLEYDKSIQKDYAEITAKMNLDRVTDEEPVINAS